jgi:hypothetical protein
MTDGFNTAYWAETYDERMAFYKTVPDSDLVKIVEDDSFLEDVPPALDELASRKHRRVEELARAIVEKKKGDEFLQSWAQEFLDDMQWQR